MIVKPRIRGFICTTAHPTGCAANVQSQIEYVEDQGTISEGELKNVLVLGCSGGYGLACRVVSAFGCGANTLGVSLEKLPEEKRTASAGWYNNIAFEEAAAAKGLYAKSLDGDAFSDEMRAEVIEPAISLLSVTTLRIRFASSVTAKLSPTVSLLITSGSGEFMIVVSNRLAQSTHSSSPLQPPPP